MRLPFFGVGFDGCGVEHKPNGHREVGSLKIRWPLADFYDARIDAQLPEATRLAETIQTCWPAILVALTEDASSAPLKDSTA